MKPFALLTWPSTPGFMLTLSHDNYFLSMSRLQVSFVDIIRTQKIHCIP